MPIISFEDLRNTVRNGVVCRFSVDTSIFVQNRFRFDAEPLIGLNLAHEKFQFILPQIIYDEVLKKYKEYLETQKNIAVESLKRFPPSDRITECLGFLNGMRVETTCRETFDRFLKNKENIVFDNKINLNRLLSLYFNCSPPFGKKEDKKYEFPDAIALQSLEMFAEDKKYNIVVISNDADWKNYCEKSVRLYGIDYNKNLLRECLFIFKAEVRYAQLEKDVNSYISDGFFVEPREHMSSMISDFFDDTSIVECEVSTYLLYEIEVSSIDVDFIDFENSKWTIVEKDSETVTANGLIPVQITCHADVDLTTWDSIDKEYIAIDSVQTEKQEEVLVEIHMRLFWEAGERLDGKSYEDCDIVSKTFYIDLGDVEPFDDEAHYHP